MNGLNERELRIPPLLSGGIMLSYRCTNECKHCIYRCSPRQADDWMTDEVLDLTIDAMRREKRLSDVHLAGGEPTMRMDFLTDVIRRILDSGIDISYVETNCHWCTDEQKALDGMQKMYDAGLRCVLISASMFHNEFIPFRNTKRGVEACRKVFGHSGTFVYQQHVYDIMDSMETDGRHSLEEFAAHARIEADPSMMARIYGLIPSGRVAEELRDSYPKAPASSFASQTCRTDLERTSHFHIDTYGNLFTGSCPGIVSGDVRGELHPALTEATHPVITTLMTRGPCGLMELAEKECAYSEREDGYISKCDLCLDVRKCMRTGNRFDELRPDAFYSE